MNKTLPVSIRLEPELKAEVLKLADLENRSLSNFIETALRRLVAEHKAREKEARRKG